VCAAWHDYQGHFLPTSIYSGCGVTLIFTSHLPVALSFALVIPPSLLQFAFELHALLVEAMEEECSPILDVVGDVSKVPLPEVSTTITLFGASSGGVASDDVEAEDTIAVDLRGAMASGPLLLLWVVSGNWNLRNILSRVMRMSQGRRLSRSQPTTKLLSSRSFLLRGIKCHLIRFAPRSCLSIGCSCIS
jgi:hypothetical protein